ncbi:hypothetical protein EV132_108122 [Rhizobium sullae]|uniref:Uncharacterized protein n=1 Tax=Rhizobium sullae TaxID=50338 RepID=A0A4R3Q664_RHISU|nr:hypothetical protein EV132_108122 [Rhizobium sullae]
MFFDGFWVPQRQSVRKIKEGLVTADLFGLLTTEPNAIVAPIMVHMDPKSIRRIRFNERPPD